MSLTNSDMSDRELLLAIHNTNGGVATSAEIAAELGKGQADRVSARLAWMRRFDMIRAVGAAKRRAGTTWELTPFGELVLRGAVNQATLRTIERADPGQAVLIMRQLARRAVDTSPETTNVVRREWQHNLAKR